MRIALAIVVSLLAGQVIADGGFTAAEIAALPPVEAPDPVPAFGKPRRNPNIGTNRPVYSGSRVPGSSVLAGDAYAKRLARKRRIATRVEQPDYGMLQVQAMAMRVWRGGRP